MDESAAVSKPYVGGGTEGTEGEGTGRNKYTKA